MVTLERTYSSGGVTARLLAIEHVGSSLTGTCSQCMRTMAVAVWADVDAARRRLQ